MGFTGAGPAAGTSKGRIVGRGGLPFAAFVALAESCMASSLSRMDQFRSPRDGGIRGDDKNSRYVLIAPIRRTVESSLKSSVA